MDLPNPYAGNYGNLIALPLALLALAVVSLLFVFPLKPGVDLKGGLLFQIQTDDANPDVALLSQKLSVFSDDVSVRVSDSALGGKGLEVELGASASLEGAQVALRELHELKERYDSLQVQLSSAKAALDSGEAGASADAVASLEKQAGALSFAVVNKSSEVVGLSGSARVMPADASESVLVAEEVFANARDGYVDGILREIKSVVSVKAYSANEVGSSLSKFFLKRAGDVVLWSFVLSSIAVFVIFRSFVPSMAVIFGAVADIAITAAVMGVLGIPLTLASIAALLMLIGFSLDTDVMLTMRVLKRSEGRAVDRAFEAMKTGFLMNFTTIAAFGVLIALATVLQVSIYFQIGAVAVIGAFADFFATWCFNAVIVLRHAEKEERKRIAKFG